MQTYHSLEQNNEMLKCCVKVGGWVEMNSGSDQPNHTKCENSLRNQQIQNNYSAHTLGLLEVEYTVYCNIVKTG